MKKYLINLLYLGQSRAFKTIWQRKYTEEELDEKYANLLKIRRKFDIMNRG